MINANENAAEASVTTVVFSECSFQSAITCGDTCPVDESTTDSTPRQFVTVTVTDSYSSFFLPDEDEETTYTVFEGVTDLEASVTMRIE